MATSTLYATILDINDQLVAASRQQIESKRDNKDLDQVAADKLKTSLKAKREELYREVAKQFLAVYFDPTLVHDGEPVLAALYRLTGGSDRYQRKLCGPIMDGLLEYEIGFTDEGDLLFMRDECIAWACKALGFYSEVKPAWDVTQLPTGQTLLKKAVSHG